MSIKSCPACLSGIQHCVPNIALKDLIARQIEQSQQNISRSSAGMVSSIPDFDEDPEVVIRRYKEQLERLNERIELLSEENEKIENVDILYYLIDCVGCIGKENKIRDNNQDAGRS